MHLIAGRGFRTAERGPQYLVWTASCSASAHLQTRGCARGHTIALETVCTRALQTAYTVSLETVCTVPPHAVLEAVRALETVCAHAPDPRVPTTALEMVCTHRRAVALETVGTGKRKTGNGVHTQAAAALETVCTGKRETGNGVRA